MNMFVILFFVFVSLLFVILFYFLNIVLSFKLSYFYKVSSFESGFLSIGKLFKSFSIHFFLIMILFVVFDLEIVYILGILISDNESFFGFILIFFFMLFSLYLEWWLGKLIWVF